VTRARDSQRGNRELFRAAQLFAALSKRLLRTHARRFSPVFSKNMSARRIPLSVSRAAAPAAAAAPEAPSSSSDSSSSSYYMIGAAVAIVAIIAIIIALFYCRGSGSSGSENCCASACPTTCYTAAQLSERVRVPATVTPGNFGTGGLPAWQSVTVSTAATISCVNNGWFRLTFAPYATAGAATLVAATSAADPVPATDFANVGQVHFIRDLTGAQPYWSAHIVSSSSGVYDIPLPTGFTLTSAPIYIYLSRHTA
jgi:hypothetical protein